MSWSTFIMGAMTSVMAYVMFSMATEEEGLYDASEDVTEGASDSVTINGRKYHQLSCQTCRKIKNHREIMPRVFECTKCKRQTNLSNVG